MGTVSRPFSFSAGATIVASQFNSNENTLYNLVNGALDTNNLASNAAIVDTQLAQITTAGKVSGAAITSLASVPSGAGVLPGANGGASVGSITFIIDGGGAVITTGVKGDLEIPFACTITRATLLADQSGSIVVDVWKDTYANFPPTVGDKITASAPPTLSSAASSQDSTLTGWTTSITAGDTLRFNVNSITTCTRVTLSLKYTRA